LRIVYKQKFRFTSSLILIFVVFLTYRFILYNNAINNQHNIAGSKINHILLKNQANEQSEFNLKYNNRNLLDNSNKIESSKLENILNKDLPNQHLSIANRGQNIQEQNIDISKLIQNKGVSLANLNLPSENLIQNKVNDGKIRLEQDSNNFLSNLERVVHLDLKGAPPKIEYLKKFIPFIKQHGATGILLEYEDTFPFTGQLAEAKYGYAYTVEDVQLIKAIAKQNGLFIIPLVQTYGHLEWLLKLKKFSHLREDSRYPQVITPCLNESYTVLYGKNLY
jgi:hypothetical protein